MSVHIDVDAIMERLGVLKAKLPEAALVAVRANVVDAVRYAVLQELSGQRLHRRTGTLQRNVTASPMAEPPRIDSPSLITGTIGTSLGYGKAHELGFQGTVNVRAFTRRQVAVRRNSRGTITKESSARLKALYGSGKFFEGRRLSASPSNVVYVRAHQMRMNIVAKHYIRDAIKAVEPKLRDYTMRSLAILGRTGKIPTLSEIRGGAGA